MFYITYENEYGALKLGGDGGYKMPVTDVLGLGSPPKEYVVNEYLGHDGQFTKSVRTRARTITIKFDVSGNLQYESRQIYRVLSFPGTLKVHFGATKRMIFVNQTSVEDFKTQGRAYRSFVVQMICDNPYFTDLSETDALCYGIVDNIKYDSTSGAWLLGTATEKQIWTSSNSDKIIFNKGDVKTEPLFCVTVLGTPTNTAGFEILKKDKSGEVIQKIKLNYTPSDGEKITVSCKSRHKDGRFIKSSENGDIANFKSTDTSLSKFWLDVGANRIVINNLLTGCTLKAYISYDNQYVEGVY